MTDLPTEYDVIVIGTGLTESIVSAALSRIGKSVLHIDANSGFIHQRNEFYGNEFSTHCLTGLMDFADTIKNSYADKPPDDIECDNNEEKFKLNYKKNLARRFFSNDMTYEWSSSSNDMNPDDNSRKHLLSKNRKFNIDLSPNIFYARGKMIELLIKSDVSKYCEFKLVKRILTRNTNDKRLDVVPTSRADVFKSTQLSMIEKRLMMQFVNATMASDQNVSSTENETISFQDFLEKKNLSTKLCDYIKNAIAMCDQNVSARHGIELCRKFLQSVGRYGDSPFLYQVYGSGELTQCFCRLSAVFGGIFYLSMDLDCLCINQDAKNQIEAVCANTKKFNAKHFVMNFNYVPTACYELNETVYTSRAILITDKSIYENDDNDKEMISLLFVPETDKSPTIHLIEVSSTAQICPDGYYVVYMFCDKKSPNTKDDFCEIIDDLYTNKSNILFSCYYSHLNLSKSNVNANHAPKNLYLTKCSNSNVDFDESVEQAKEIFEKICPNEEFLPKPPEPEDIVFDDDADDEVDNGKKTDQTKNDDESSDSMNINSETSPEKSENEGEPKKEKQEKI